MTATLTIWPDPGRHARYLTSEMTGEHPGMRIKHGRIDVDVTADVHTALGEYLQREGLTPLGEPEARGERCLTLEVE